MAWVDTACTVQGVTNDRLKVKVGPWTIEIMKEDLQRWIAGELDCTPILIANMGIRLALTGVDIEDDVGIKRELERVTFKTWR